MPTYKKMKFKIFISLFALSCAPNYVLNNKGEIRESSPYHTKHEIRNSFETPPDSFVAKNNLGKVSCFLINNENRDNTYSKCDNESENIHSEITVKYDTVGTYILVYYENKKINYLTNVKYYDIKKEKNVIEKYEASYKYIGNEFQEADSNNFIRKSGPSRDFSDSTVYTYDGMLLKEKTFYKNNKIIQIDRYEYSVKPKINRISSFGCDAENKCTEYAEIKYFYNK